MKQEDYYKRAFEIACERLEELDNLLYRIDRECPPSNKEEYQKMILNTLQSRLEKNNNHQYQDNIYTVEITETLQYQEDIKARNKEEAERMIKEKYDNCEIVLNENNHVSTDFKVVNCKKEIEKTIDEKEDMYEYDIDI